MTVPTCVSSSLLLFVGCTCFSGDQASQLSSFCQCISGKSPSQTAGSVTQQELGSHANRHRALEHHILQKTDDVAHIRAQSCCSLTWPSSSLAKAIECCVGSILRPQWLQNMYVVYLKKHLEFICRKLVCYLTGVETFFSFIHFQKYIVRISKKYSYSNH